MLGRDGSRNERIRRGGGGDIEEDYETYKVAIY